VIEVEKIVSGAWVSVGVAIERAAIVLMAVKKSDGRVFVRARLYGTNAINDYPRSVVRLMRPSEIAQARSRLRVDDDEPKPKQRNAKPWRKRQEAKAKRLVPASKAQPVSIYDIAKAGDFSEMAVDMALRKHGVQGK
jgi:hypothetical protein